MFGEESERTMMEPSAGDSSGGLFSDCKGNSQYEDI